MHGYFSPNIPGCFVLDRKEGFLKGDVVVLGQDTCRKVVMEEIIEVGKHFILYKVKEVGLIPMGGVWITQLVNPLNLYLQSFFAFCYSSSWHSSPASFDPQLSLGR